MTFRTHVGCEPGYVPGEIRNDENVFCDDKERKLAIFHRLSFSTSNTYLLQKKKKREKSYFSLTRFVKVLESV